MTNNNPFLPDNYKVPAGASNYYKLEQGQNKFRILGSPILGYEGWKDKKPIRKRMTEKFTVNEVDEPEKIKHFWSMPVWDYREKRSFNRQPC